MHQYEWDPETGGLLLKPQQEKMSKEPRPVYYREMNMLGMNQRWSYPQNDDAPIMWAEAEKYIYRGRVIAKTKGGSLFTAPQIIYEESEEGEPVGADLLQVDLKTMCARNSDIMTTLVEDTVKHTYETYKKYKNIVDVFHVSFSGGKDSVVCLDIVQRSIPHSDFIVIFGDTRMEFPDTLGVVNETKRMCEEQGIKFYTARSDIDPMHYWRVFGPPSNTIRWCCSVYKTTPQLLKLREYVGRDDVVEMAFVGVRASESIKRSKYEFISVSTKHKGQYSCNPIHEWNSAEVYLYMFINNLILNEAYKKGNSRVGCLLCPMAGDSREYMRRANYCNEVDKYVKAIVDTDARCFPTQEELHHFVDMGGWKVRNNGRDIKTVPINYVERSSIELEVLNSAQCWKEWLKTMGTFVMEGDICVLKHGGETYRFTVMENGEKVKVLFDEDMLKRSGTVVKHIKYVFRKAAYCVGCKECQADCHYGCLTFVDGSVRIDDKCRHCLSCHKPEGGCLLFHSLEQPKGIGKMNKKSLDSYADHAPKAEWIEQFFSLQDDFFDNHTLGTMMFSMFKRFLRDAELIDNNKLTNTAHVLSRLGESNPAFWAIMLVNLSYSQEVGWYIKHMPLYKTLDRETIMEMLKEFDVKERGAKSITGAYKRLLALPFGSYLGLGQVQVYSKTFTIERGSWYNPIPEIILYSLYKFAEACGGLYQFSLSYLMDETIERDGVSPTTIFGLDRDTMIGLLNGLAINYSDYISASIVMDLETITLRPDKTAQDILQLL